MKYIKEAIQRTNEDQKNLRETVAEIIEKIRKAGDAAIMDFNQRFDGNSRKTFRVTREEIEAAYLAADSSIIEMMKKAKANIQAFAMAQKNAIAPLDSFEVQPGAVLGHRVIPVDSCCCYVPGGNFPLFSTALMLAIPAKVAGVRRVAACSPAMKGTEKIHPLTLVAMDLAGVDEIYTMGGAHAIAAFSYGTAQINPVDMIVGPGNQYVTEAKRQCYGQVGIDFVAGPSEVLIIADDTAVPEILAADLLGQSEHDLLAKGILVTTSRAIAESTLEQVKKQLDELPFKGIAYSSWDTYGEIILAESLEEAVEISNRYAPEHLEIVLKNPDFIQNKLTNYGSLFIGENAAEVFGDYVSGTNHTLPTLRASRYTGGVWAGSFLKVCTHQRISSEAMANLAPLVSGMARAEGLIAHARAAELRLERLEPQGTPPERE